MKACGRVLIIACVLTVATWILFAQAVPDAPLNAASTTAVLCAWLVITGIVQLILKALAGVEGKWWALVAVVGLVAGCSLAAWFLGHRSQAETATARAEVASSLNTQEWRRELDASKTAQMRAPDVNVKVTELKATLTRVSARGFLIGQDHEEEGFGLYSYVLFAEPPSDAVKERYVEAIRAYINKFQTVQVIQNYVPEKKKINVTYLPVTKAVSENPLKPEDVLNVYNYGKAKGPLLNLGGPERTSGPYIISTLKPLSDGLGTQDHFLYLDFSALPSEMVAAWVSEFIHQSSEESFWQERTMPMFMLKLRTDIEYAALAVPQVKASAKEIEAFLSAYIGWFNKGQSGSDAGPGKKP